MNNDESLKFHVIDKVESFRELYAAVFENISLTVLKYDIDPVLISPLTTEGKISEHDIAELEHELTINRLLKQHLQPI